MCTPLVLLWFLSIPFFTNAAIPQPKGFLLNCGGPEFKAENGLSYIPDHSHIFVGNTTSVQEPDVLPLLKTLRYFPDTASRKYCYTFPVTKGGKFLIRTTYYYGDFDGKKEPPVFDQIIDGTRWSIVNTTEDYANGLSSYYEIIITAQAKSLSVCLAKNEDTVSSPFISALEVIHLEKSLYNSTDFSKHALSLVAQASFGSDGDIISYPDDAFNRDWQPFMDGHVAEESHSNISTSGFWNIPPAKTFTTAITASQAQALTVKWPPFPLPDSIYYVVFYFQESRSPGPFSWRVFDVSVNGEVFYKSLNVTTAGVSVYSTEWPLAGQVEIVMNPQRDMRVGPLINAGEIFQILPLGGRTVTRDVKVMEKLAKSLKNLPPDWNGDPCLPKEHMWTGVTCSEGKNTRIISLNLTSRGISGTLPADIANLTAISSVWLGGNKLSGTIPDMSSLKALESLHLEDNKLEGTIPQSLGELPKLKEVFLQNNNLTGSIPNNLVSTKEINLQQNSGSLPVPEPNTDEMRQIFDKFDTDRDGKISHEEYKAIIRAVQKDSTSKDVQKIFEVADLDGDGFISYDEFVNVQKRGGVLKMVDIQNAFRLFDLNGDGKISVEEIFELMERLGEKCSLQDCRKMLRAVDTNQDGFVDIDEFLAMMTHSAN